jgi:hypothetical protein
MTLHGLGGAGRHPHQGLDPLHLRRRSRLRALRLQGIEQGFLVGRLEPRIEKIANTSQDGAVAVDKTVEASPQGELKTRKAARKEGERIYS